MIQFRHVRLNEYHCALLADLMALQDEAAAPAVVVEETIGEGGLVFRPPLRRSGFHPIILTQLAEHGLVDLTHVAGGSAAAYRVYVTPVGRDCYDDMCGLT